MFRAFDILCNVEGKRNQCQHSYKFSMSANFVSSFISCRVVSCRTVWCVEKRPVIYPVISSHTSTRLLLIPNSTSGGGRRAPLGAQCSLNVVWATETSKSGLKNELNKSHIDFTFTYSTHCVINTCNWESWRSERTKKKKNFHKEYDELALTYGFYFFLYFFAQFLFKKKNLIEIHRQ